MGHFDTEEVLKMHKLYCRGVDTTGEVLLLNEANRKEKFENVPYAIPQYIRFSLHHPTHLSFIFKMKPLCITLVSFQLQIACEGAVPALR